MIPMQTPVTITKPEYKGTQGVIDGKHDRVDLYSVRTTLLVFYGKEYPYPHGTTINFYPEEFEVRAHTEGTAVRS